MGMKIIIDRLRSLFHRAKSPIDRQRLIVYIVSVCLAEIGMTLHLTSVVGASSIVLQSLSVVFIIGTFLPFILWLCQKINLVIAFFWGSIIAQIVQTVKIIFITVAMSTTYHFLITVNGVVSMVIVCLLAVSYMRKTTIIVGTANLLTLLFTAIWVGSNWSWQFFVITTLYTVFFALLSFMMYHNIKHMQDENSAYHIGEKHLLQILRLNRKEITAYVEMCRTENIADKDTDRLFSMLSEKSQRNVIHAVERKKALDTSRSKDLKKIFPTFTPMEIEVSRLILRGTKLSQIVDATGKSEANISVVRSHIRKKLGLAPSDNLREALVLKVKQ